jgi:carbamoyl-phosphate synthase small subunit
MKKNQDTAKRYAKLVLEDGSEYLGWSFGRKRSVAGELVFNTGMNDPVQSLSDPGCHGQIVVCTSPVAGNCGAPVKKNGTPYFDENNLPVYLESEQIHAAGLVVADLNEEPSHYLSGITLSAWLDKQNTTGICGIDTRALTIRLRKCGTMRAKIVVEGKSETHFNSCFFANPANVSHNTVKSFLPSAKNDSDRVKIALMDCGVKANIIRCLLERNAEIIRVPYTHELNGIEYDGLLISSGPGDPKDCIKTIKTISRAFTGKKPVFGIGLGNLIMALAAGAETYKMPFGHRGLNHPSIEAGQNRCYVTSQNHGYAVRGETLPKEWQPWFINANDETIEGIRNVNRPFSAVQFYPEGCPGPRDTEFLFDRFICQIRECKE